jgi:glycosyltransferase involved in cell wall biosynthesis
MSTTPVKILYLITKARWGGAQRYVHDLATRIGASGDSGGTKITVAVALGGDGADDPHGLATRLAKAGVRTLLVPGLGRDIALFSDLRAFFALIKILRRERPDICHVNSSKAAFLGALAARIIGILPSLQPTSYKQQPRAVFTLHGLPSREPRNLLWRCAVALGTWLTALLSHTTIAVCEADRRAISRWPFVGEKAVTIYNGIEPPDFLDRETARREIGECVPGAVTPEPSTLMVTIAELHPNKGIENLIEALASLQPTSYNLQAVVIGSGELRPRLETLIKKHGLERGVFLAGHIPDAARFLKAADLFVLPSVKEGLPYALLEAALAEAPVIATAVGGVPEIIAGDALGTLVPPGNPDALARAIRRAVADLPGARERARALAARAAKTFAVENFRLKTLAVYLSAVVQ